MFLIKLEIVGTWYSQTWKNIFNNTYQITDIAPWPNQTELQNTVYDAKQQNIDVLHFISYQNSCLIFQVIMHYNDIIHKFKIIRNILEHNSLNGYLC